MSTFVPARISMGGSSEISTGPVALRKPEGWLCEGPEPSADDHGRVDSRCIPVGVPIRPGAWLPQNYAPRSGTSDRSRPRVEPHHGGRAWSLVHPHQRIGRISPVVRLGHGACVSLPPEHRLHFQPTSPMGSIDLNHWGAPQGPLWPLRGGMCRKFSRRRPKA